MKSGAGPRKILRRAKKRCDQRLTAPSAHLADLGMNPVPRRSNGIFMIARNYPDWWRTLSKSKPGETDAAG